MSLINCPECNHEVSDQAATCPNCGYILKTEKTTNVTSVASLPEKKKKKLGCLFYCSIIILILMTITIVGAVLGNDTPSSNNNTNYGNQNAALSTNAPTSFAAKNINGLSNKQGEKIDKILSQCGLKDASSITAESSLDSRYKGKKGYILVIGNIKNVFVFLDKKQNVYKITYKNHTLYGKGKVKSTLNDYCMTAEEQDTVRISCEEKIKEILTSPSTAEFADRNEWAFSKNKHTLLVQGYVDSQNGFGAMIRSDFQFEIDRKTNKIKSLIFDGKELIS